MLTGEVGVDGAHAPLVVAEDTKQELGTVQTPVTKVTKVAKVKAPR